MFLRFFVNLYDMEVVDEEVYLRWKEEVNDEYPGKGKALFQVGESDNSKKIWPFPIWIDLQSFPSLFSLSAFGAQNIDLEQCLYPTVYELNILSIDL